MRYKDGYLVNPQVSLTVRIYARQRFTVLGRCRSRELMKCRELKR